MIGKLSGVIDNIEGNSVILDVGGVGYLVQASARTLAAIGNKGDPASLLIDTHVREDAITLIGFAEASEQSWFRLLNSVQGVGAKAAFSILAACPVDKLALVIAAQDKAALTQADGVGPKLAARILTELKDKAANIELGQAKKTQKYQDIKDDTSSDSLDKDAVSALINLGYGRADAYSAVMNAKGKANDNLEELIREALKELSA